MRSDFVEKDVLGHLLFALTLENRLACRVALETGLRIGDVLSLKTVYLQNNSFTIVEQKTKKKRTIRLSVALRKELKQIAGTTYIFEHRTDPTKHRTRQAVYNDIKRALKLFRVKDNVSPHSLRKAYAVDLFRRYGDLERVQKALNHDNELVTILYATADLIKKKRG